MSEESVLKVTRRNVFIPSISPGSALARSIVPSQGSASTAGICIPFCAAVADALRAPVVSLALGVVFISKVACAVYASAPREHLGTRAKAAYLRMSEGNWVKLWQCLDCKIDKGDPELVGPYYHCWKINDRTGSKRSVTAREKTPSIQNNQIQELFNYVFVTQLTIIFILVIKQMSDGHHLWMEGFLWLSSAVSNLHVHKRVPDIRAHSEWAVAADRSVGGGGPEQARIRDDTKPWWSVPLQLVCLRLCCHVWLMPGAVGQQPECMKEKKKKKAPCAAPSLCKHMVV